MTVLGLFLGNNYKTEIIGWQEILLTLRLKNQRGQDTKIYLNTLEPFIKMLSKFTNKFSQPVLLNFFFCLHSAVLSWHFKVQNIFSFPFWHLWKINLEHENKMLSTKLCIASMHSFPTVIVHLWGSDYSFDCGCRPPGEGKITQTIKSDLIVKQTF